MENGHEPKILDTELSIEKGYGKMNLEVKTNSQFKAYEAQSLTGLRPILKRKVRDWNGSRIHSSLKGRSPDEFIKAVLFQTLKG